MHLDERRKRLYVFGRNGERGENALSDFFFYDIPEMRWTRLSSDTLQDGGPPLLYDHAMCVAPDTQRLYVYGGVVVPQDKAARKSYGGLYVYDIYQAQWTTLREDGDLDRSIALFYGREGAGLCVHSDGRIYIVGGQRHGVWQSEGMIYDPSTDTCTVFALPHEGIYLGATLIAEQRNELFVFGGMVKTDMGGVRETSAVRCYAPEHGVWAELPLAPQADSPQVLAPAPRYASSQCYDSETRALYVFGGACSSQAFHTLGDLWIGRLRPAPKPALMTRIRILLRTLRCSELKAIALRAGEDYYEQMLRPLLSDQKQLVIPRPELSSRAQLYREILGMLPRSCFMKPQERQQRMQQIASFDWNSAFQDLLEHPVQNARDEREKFTKLHRLTSSFVQAARPIAEQLILDSFLPAARKLFRTSNIGGRAGGQKFVVGRIFFKFAVDTFGYYGGDQNAAKAAGHEHKSLTELLTLRNHKLHVPLFALFTLHGKRLLAASVLPISRASLVYGSNDGGRNVHDEHPEMRRQMALVAAQLNLKEHQIRNTGKRLVMPGDIEGHLSEVDGRLYVIDAARMFPPSAPSAGRRVSLFNLLRPELVRQNAVPLSSDAYFRWGDPDNVLKHNKDVDAATQRLLRVIIPNFAAKLTETDAEAMVAALHKSGINLRYLGLVHVHCASSAVRLCVLREMVARTFKCYFHDQMRGMRIGGEQDFGNRVVLLFNLLFSTPESANAETFWVDLGRQLKRKYQVPLAPSHCLAVLADNGRHLLYVRLQQLTGVLFRVPYPPTHSSPFSFRALKALLPIIKAPKLPPALTLQQYEAQYTAELHERETALGTTDHPALLNLLLNIARVARWQGDDERARALTQRALAISLREAGVDEERLLDIQRLVLQVSGLVQGRMK